MESGEEHNKFIFNEKIDSEFLHNLYEDDYQYMVEVFETTLRHFDEDVLPIQSAFGDSDFSGLRKALHKVKPVFGFTGLLRHQEVLGKFEEACSGSQNISELHSAYDSLMELIHEGRDIIEKEHKRLLAFTDFRS